MSNNVPDKIKPFGTLRDFGAGHLGHYETSLCGHRLGPFGTLQDFFLGHYKTLWKNFLRALRTPPEYLKARKFFFQARCARPPPPPPGGPTLGATAVTRNIFLIAKSLIIQNRLMKHLAGKEPTIPLHVGQQVPNTRGDQE